LGFDFYVISFCSLWHRPLLRSVQSSTFYGKLSVAACGNKVSEYYRNADGIVVEIRSTLYSNGQKIITYGINSDGDTTSITRYDDSGGMIRESTEHKDAPFIQDTTWYSGSREIKNVFVDQKANLRRKEVHKYDEKGNEIENILYK
jgi:antitoxin component YwqK of YwqJK toxin-antitoxin module